MGGRQPDVEDRDVRRQRGHPREQLVGAAAARQDLAAGVGQQAGDALAQQHAVLGDHDAHGISALTRVPPPRGLHTRSRPSSASTRSARPRSPEPPSVSAPPDAVVDDLDRHLAARAAHDDRRRRRLGVLADVGQALGDEVVRRDLERLRQPLAAELDVELHRDRRARGELLQRDREAVAADHRRVQAARDLAQLLERGRDLPPHPLDAARRPPGRRPRAARACPSSSESAMRRCWAPSCRLRSRRWRSLWPASITRAREPVQLLQARPQLDLEARVLDGDAGRRGDGRQQLRVVAQRRVVHERRDPRAVAVDRRSPPAPSRAAASPPPARRRRRSKPNSGSQ